MNHLSKLKAWLITALVCFIAAQMLMTLVTPLAPYLVTGLVAVLVIGFLFHRSKKL